MPLGRQSNPRRVFFGSLDGPHKMRFPNTKTIPSNGEGAAFYWEYFPSNPKATSAIRVFQCPLFWQSVPSSNVVFWGSGGPIFWRSQRYLQGSPKTDNKIKRPFSDNKIKFGHSLLGPQKVFFQASCAESPLLAGFEKRHFVPARPRNSVWARVWH